LQVAIALRNLCICTRPSPELQLVWILLNAHKGTTTCVLPPGRLRLGAISRTLSAVQYISHNFFFFFFFFNYYPIAPGNYENPTSLSKEISGMAIYYSFDFVDKMGTLLSIWISLDIINVMDWLKVMKPEIRHIQITLTKNVID
jgi:hypothetical protein